MQALAGFQYMLSLSRTKTACGANGHSGAKETGKALVTA